MKRKATALVMAFVLVLCSGAFAFADIDYSQWDSQAAYPSDIRDTPYFTAVKSLMDRGVVNGKPDGLFHPEDPITRGEFAKMIAIATNSTGNLAKMENAAYFTDLSGHGWAKGYINCVAEAGFLNGYGDKTYKPGNNITYAEAMAAIVRTKGDAANYANSLGTWPNNYIKYAQMFNMTGDVNTTDWNAPATRGDIAKWIYKNISKTGASAASGVNVTGTVSGSNVTLTVAASVNGGNLSYQWYKNGAQISGATSYIYTGSLPAAGQTDTYYAMVTTQRSGYSDTSVTSGNVTVDSAGVIK